MDTNKEYEKKLNRSLAVRLTVLVMLLLGIAAGAVYHVRFSPGFHTDGKGRYYISGETGKRQGGLVTVSKRTRLLDPASAVVKTYLLDEDGYTQTGFVEYEGQTFYLAGDGTVTRGICSVDGVRRCFDAEVGAMLRSSFYTLPDSDPEEIYYFDENGVSVTGVLVLGEDVYYFSSRGTLERGLAMINGRKVYFGEDGRMTLGFVTLPEGTYYFGKGGVAVQGFQNIGADLYYFDPGTNLMKTGFLSFEAEDPPMLFGDDGARGSGLTVYNGKTYYTDPFGTMMTGWVSDGGKVRYFDEEGIMTVGFARIDGNDYYFEEGIMQTGWKAAEGDLYYFYDDGHMAKGVCSLYGDLYRFGADGCFYDGFITVGDEKYYYDEFGFPVTGLRTINGYLYCFDETSMMLRDAWMETEDGTMYFRTDGTAVTGEKKIGSVKYFFGEDHLLFTGFRKIDGFTYYFDGRNGMLTGTHMIGGEEYTFAENGILASEIEQGRNGKEQK